MVFGDFFISLFYKNKAAKNVVWKCYSQYYSSEEQRQLAAGVATHDVAVHLIVSV